MSRESLIPASRKGAAYRRTCIFVTADGTKLWRADDGSWTVTFKPPSEYGRLHYPVHFFTVTVDSDGVKIDVLHFDKTSQRV